MSLNSEPSVGPQRPEFHTCSVLTWVGPPGANPPREDTPLCLPACPVPPPTSQRRGGEAREGFREELDGDLQPRSRDELWPGGRGRKWFGGGSHPCLTGRPPGLAPKAQAGGMGLGVGTHRPGPRAHWALSLLRLHRDPSRLGCSCGTPPPQADPCQVLTRLLGPRWAEFALAASSLEALLTDERTDRVAGLRLPYLAPRVRFLLPGRHSEMELGGPSPILWERPSGQSASRSLGLTAPQASI